MRSAAKRSPWLFFLLCLTVAAFRWPACADDFKWTSLIPDEGEVVAVVADPDRPEIVYAGTASAGVLKTTDGGATWRAANAGLGSLEVPEIRGLAMDKNRPGRLFAATAAGVYRTDDGGEAWALMDRRGTYALAIAPSDSSLIFVDISNTVLKSTNGGKSWTVIRKGKTHERIHTLRINPANPNIIYAGSQSEMIKSTDGGANWASCKLPAERVFDKPIRLTSPSIAYPYDIALNPVNPNMVYVATSGGVMKSTDGGASWVSINAGLPGPNVSVLAIDPSRAQTVFAATPEQSLFKSTDGGASWAASRTGLGDALINALAVSPSQKYLVYAGTNRGVAKSTDGGVHWTMAKAALHDLDIRSLVVSPADSNIIYAKLLHPPSFRSTNRGASWEPVVLDWPNSFAAGFAADPSNPLIAYAATAKGMLKSVDGGMNWTGINGGLPKNYSYVVAVDPTNPKVIYAVVSDVENVLRPLSGIYKSTNAGASWQLSNNGLGQGNPNIIAIAPSDTQIVYTAIGSALYKSTNAGANWALITEASTVTPYTLAIDPANPNVVFAATALGLYKTVNGGEDWRRLVIDPQTRAVMFVITDPHAGSLVYANTSRSVFVSADAGETWTEANYGLPAVSIYVLAIDPSDPDLIYAATNRAGPFKRRFAILTIASVVEARRGLSISGRHFSLSPRVFINGVDCTNFIINASDQFIQLKGSTTKLNLKPGDNHIQVTNTERPLANTSEGSSNVFILKR